MTTRITPNRLLHSSACLTAVGAVLALASPAQARDFYVDQTAADPSNYDCTKANPCGTIRWAVDFAVDGDVVIVRGDFVSPLLVPLEQAITIRGAGDGASIDMQGADRHFLVDLESGEVTLENLILIGGLVTAANPDGPHGGSVLVQSGALHVDRVEFVDNESEGDGGAIACEYDTCTGLTVTGSVFQGNRAGSEAPFVWAGGGAIRTYAPTDVDDSYFQDNWSSVHGGAIWGSLSSTTLTITDTQFEGNEASTGGGGAVYPSPGTTTVRRSSFWHNEAVFGGALGGQFGTLRVLNSTLYENSGSLSAGAISAATLLLNNSTLVDNFSEQGEQDVVGLAVDMNNTVMAHPNPPPLFSQVAICSAQTLTGDYNLMDKDCMFGSTGAALPSVAVGTMQAGDLGTFDYHGGATKVFSIVANSPAHNGGGNQCMGLSQPLPYDQRGESRPAQGVCDIGAYELQLPPIDIDIDLDPPIPGASFNR